MNDFGIPVGSDFEERNIAKRDFQNKMDGEDVTLQSLIGHDRLDGDSCSRDCRNGKILMRCFR